MDSRNKACTNLNQLKLMEYIGSVLKDVTLRPMRYRISSFRVELSWAGGASVNVKLEATSVTLWIMPTVAFPAILIGIQMTVISKNLVMLKRMLMMVTGTRYLRTLILSALESFIVCNKKRAIFQVSSMTGKWNSLSAKGDLISSTHLRKQQEAF